MQAQLLQDARPQPARHPPDLVEAAPGGLLRLEQLGPQVGGGVVGGVLQLEQDGGEGLPHLVVQLLRDPPALGLLGGEHPGTARGPLGLQPVEHRVERTGQVRDLAPARHLRAPAGPQQVRRPHHPGEALERREAHPQQEGVGHEHRHQAGHEDERLADEDRGGDRDGAEEQQHGDDQDRGVQQEEAPVQRHRPASPRAHRAPSGPRRDPCPASS